MKERTANNVHMAFVGEAKANQRLQTYAKKLTRRPAIKSRL